MISMMCLKKTKKILKDNEMFKEQGFTGSSPPNSPAAMLYLHLPTIHHSNDNADHHDPDSKFAEFDGIETGYRVMGVQPNIPAPSVKF